MFNLPAIKKRCEADPTVVFIGDEVLLLVEALEVENARLQAELVEAQGKLLAIKGRLLEIVEECEETGEDPSYLFSMLDTIDPEILEPITEILQS